MPASTPSGVVAAHRALTAPAHGRNAFGQDTQGRLRPAPSFAHRCFGGQAGNSGL